MKQTLDNEVRALRDSGDVARACERLLAALGPELRSYLRLQLADDAQGDDEYQELSLIILQGIDRFQARSTVRTWAYGIAHNLLRRTKLRRSLLAEVALSPQEMDALPSPWAGHDHRVLHHSAIRSALSARQHEAWTLRVEYGFSYREIGALMGVNSDTAKARCHRARRLLLHLLRQDEAP